MAFVPCPQIRPPNPGGGQLLVKGWGASNGRRRATFKGGRKLLGEGASMQVNCQGKRTTTRGRRATTRGKRVTTIGEGEQMPRGKATAIGEGL
jgi:hypothetical protein